MAPAEDLPDKLGTLSIREMNQLSDQNIATKCPVVLNPFYFNIYPRNTKRNYNSNQRRNCDSYILSVKKPQCYFKSSNQKSSLKKISLLNKHKKRSKDPSLTSLYECLCQSRETCQDMHRSIRVTSTMDCISLKKNEVPGCDTKRKNIINLEDDFQNDSALKVGSIDPNADDITIDELACYFENFVHIPKKMSSMAEMMYI